MDSVKALNSATALSAADADVRALISAGSDIEATTPEGCTALMSAADQGHTKTIKALIAAGANVNAKSNKGSTALMFAVSRYGYNTDNSEAIAKMLIAAGANVNARNNKGETALADATTATIAILGLRVQGGRSLHPSHEHIWYLRDVHCFVETFYFLWRLWVDAIVKQRQDDGGTGGGTGDAAGREASGRLRFGPEPA